eukprot:m.3041 g.3041  ORF g.3041 m.3041 type:complete len:413 (+) comp2009_c0_seq1:192-1430(+)
MMQVSKEWLDTFNPEKPIDVVARYEIHHISNVDTVRQTFECDFAVEVSWEALEDDFKKNTPKNGDIDWESLWNPRLVCRNASTLKSFESYYRVSKTLSQPLQKGNYNHNPEGNTWLSCRIEVSGIFTVKMSLKEFPFDEQNLRIIMRSMWRHDWIRFRPHPKEGYKSIINMQYASSLSNEFDIDPIPDLHFELKECEKHVGSTRSWSKERGGLVKHNNGECAVCTKVDKWPFPNHTDSRHAGSGKSYPLAPLSISIIRKGSYYLWNVVFPAFLITTASAVSMVTNPEDPKELLDQRMSITLTLLLTLVAVKFVVANDIPNVSYLTWLDTYILWGFVVITLVVVQNVIASLVSDSLRGVVDKIGLIAFAVLWIGSHILAFLIYFPKRRTRKLGGERYVVTDFGTSTDVEITPI